MSAHPDILIVVPCLNEEAHLPGLLDLLLAESGGARIVIADGGSSDRSRDIVEGFASRHPQVILLDNPARLQAAGVNRAVRLHGSDCQWLVRVDAHCDYPHGYVAGLLAAATAQGAKSVVVPMVSRGLGCFQKAAAAAQNSKLGTGGSPHRHVGTGCFVDHGHHALMALDIFRAVGGYNEAMSHNEDAELDCRIRSEGGRIWLEPSLALTYYPRGTLRGLWKQYWNYGRGRARTVSLHGQKLKLRQMLPLLVPVAAGLALPAPWFPVLAAPLILWALLCLGAGVAIGLRMGGGCRLFSGVAAMTMHMAWGLGFLRERVFAEAPHPVVRPL